MPDVQTKSSIMAELRQVLAIPALARLLFDETEEKRQYVLSEITPGLAIIFNRAFTGADAAGGEQVVSADSAATVIAHDLEFWKDEVYGSVTIATSNASGAAVTLTLQAKDCDFRLASDLA